MLFTRQNTSRLDTVYSKIFIGLFIMSLLNILLVVFRLYWVGFVWGDIEHYRDVYFFRNEPTFVFLIWNLFLAWIPFIFGMVLHRWQAQLTKKGMVVGILGLWLLFFPNAPYILTDLIHLRPRLSIPYWYDILLFNSFALTGLFLGLISMHPVHLYMRQLLPEKLAHSLIIVFLLLGCVGIYLGRFLRWNSWDVIYQPKGIITDLHNIFFYPGELFPELGICLLIFSLLYPVYWLISVMLETKFYSKTSSGNHRKT